jgi:two-component system, NarL family, response regulator LiaR
MSDSTINVLIVDDHVIVRKGIKALLNEVNDIVVIGEASNGEEAIVMSEKLKPDVILMDLIMPEVDGILATSKIVEKQPEVRILALTSYTSDELVFPAIKAGALGYLLKDSDPKELVNAIRQVYKGEPSLHPSIAIKVLQELSHPTEGTPTPDPLSVREVEVLKHVAKGLSNQQIADFLGIAEVTVRTHVSNILSKLHLANRVQATLYALRAGLVNLDGQDLMLDGNE